MPLSDQAATVTVEFSEAIRKWPVDEMALPDGTLMTKVADVGGDQIMAMLREGDVIIAIVDLGKPVRWMSGADAFVVWKADVQEHLAEPHAHVHLDDAPGRFAYLASHWSVDSATRHAIVCVKVH